MKKLLIYIWCSLPFMEMKRPAWALRDRTFACGFCAQSLPSWLKREPCWVPPVSPQWAERPHDQLDLGIVDIPEIDILMSDLHCAFAINVQVWCRHKIHVESLCKETRNGENEAKRGVTFYGSTVWICTPTYSLQKVLLCPLVTSIYTAKHYLFLLYGKRSYS